MKIPLALIGLALFLMACAQNNENQETCIVREICDVVGAEYHATPESVATGEFDLPTCLSGQAM